MMVAGFHLAATGLFRSRLAGLLAVIAAFLLTDEFTNLFAFGGLLQAGAIACTAFMVAAFVRAPGAGRRAWLFWTIGSGCLALAALSHLATGLMAIAIGAVIAVISVAGLGSSVRARVRAVVPVILCLGVIGAWWLIVLLPGSSEYASNPASLSYRGPDRLLEVIVDHLPTVGVVVFGSLAILVGAVRELWRKAPGSFSVLAAWLGVVGGMLLYSVATSASTDYPRFTTPLLMPLALATAGGMLSCAGAVRARVRSSRRAPARILARATWTGLPASLATLLLISAAPVAAYDYGEAARGYQLLGMDDLRSAAAWIDANIPEDATVLAAAREGKWLEGFTGRGALFANPIRYSVRTAEWRRSFAATALLQSNATLTSPAFLVRLLGGDVCTGAAPAGRAVVSMNHGGEFVDLVRVSTSTTRILGAPAAAQAATSTGQAPSGTTATSGTLATISNLTGSSSTLTSTQTEAQVSGTWSGQRKGRSVGFTESLSVSAEPATVLDVASSTELAMGGIEVEIRPAGTYPIIDTSISGTQAELTFVEIGNGSPRLHIAAHGAGASIRLLDEDGGIVVNGSGSQLEIVMTDFTASKRAAATVGTLCPTAIVDEYKVRAAVLKQDGAYPERAARLAAIGFTHVEVFGSYVVLSREPTVEDQP